MSEIERGLSSELAAEYPFLRANFLNTGVSATCELKSGNLNGCEVVAHHAVLLRSINWKLRVIDIHHKPSTNCATCPIGKDSIQKPPTLV